MRVHIALLPIVALIAVMSVGLVFGADLPKEVTYDFDACWSGVANSIQFSKTHSAATYEMLGTIRSNPPGGMFDKQSFRCVGMNTSFDGKNSGTVVCEVMDRDGEKQLTYFSLGSDGKVTREHIAGTGKYEGMVSSGTATLFGPFPNIKPGTVQNCNHQTGTYKLK